MNKPISWICTICFVFILQSAFAECIATYLVTRRNGVVVDRELLYVTCSDDPSFSGEESGAYGNFRCSANKRLGSAFGFKSTCDLYGRISGSEQSGGFDGFVYLKSLQLKLTSNPTIQISCSSVKVVDYQAKAHTWKKSSSTVMEMNADFLVVLKFTGGATELGEKLAFGLLTFGDQWSREFSDQKFYLNYMCFTKPQ